MECIKCKKECVRTGSNQKYCKECRLNNRPIKICVKCLQLKPHHAKSMCKDCYNISFRDKDYFRKYMKQYLKQDRVMFKQKVRKKSNYHIKIENQLCVICKKNKAKDRHHVDYNKPLAVILLCKKCHKWLHSLN